jgi:hypothetical protein
LATRIVETINAGIHITMNTVWKYASMEIAAPDQNPKRSENRLPAHVGHPINRPLVNPTLPSREESFLV